MADLNRMAHRIVQESMAEKTPKTPSLRNGRHGGSKGGQAGAANGIIRSDASDRGPSGSTSRGRLAEQPMRQSCAFCRRGGASPGLPARERARPAQ
jgi:hypothetical protein